MEATVPELLDLIQVGLIILVATLIGRTFWPLVRPLLLSLTRKSRLERLREQLEEERRRSKEENEARKIQAELEKLRTVRSKALEEEIADVLGDPPAQELQSSDKTPTATVRAQRVKN